MHHLLLCSLRQALEAAGVAFIHPALELQEQNIARRSKMLMIRKQYQEKDVLEVAPLCSFVSDLFGPSSDLHKQGVLLGGGHKREQ